MPLIQIETDQREECVGESEHIISERSPLEEKERCLEEEKVPEAGKGEDAALSACQNPRWVSDLLDELRFMGLQFAP